MATYHELVLNVGDIEGNTFTADTTSSATCYVSYDRTVRTTDGVLVPPPAAKPIALPVTGDASVQVLASDDPDLAADSAGFGIRVRVVWTEAPSWRQQSKTYLAQVHVADAATVNLSDHLATVASSGVTVLQGPRGRDNVLTVGTVTTGAPDSPAAVTITGESPSQVVNFTIPKGDTGASGVADDAGVAAVVDQSGSQTQAALDTTTAGFIGNNASSTRGALNGIYTIARPDRVDIRTAAPSLDLSGTASATTALQAAMDALQAGATLTIPDGAVLNLSSGAVTPTKRLNIDARGATFTNNGTAASFHLTSVANGSRWTGGTMQGNKPTTYTAGHKAFWIDGQPGAWVDNLRFEAVSVDGFGYGGWYGTNVSNLMVIDPRVTNSVYVGTQLLSAQGVKVIRPYVKQLQGIAANGYQQSYPVAFTRDQTKASITDYPNSIDCEANGGYVANTGWEGVDTHGGRNIRVIDMEIHGCIVGVACVPCPDQNGTDAWGPRDILIQGLRAYADVSDGAMGSAVRIVGAGSAGSTVEAATGIVSDVLAVDYGPGPSDPATTGGALQFYQTQGLVVHGARLIRPSHFGVALYYDNQDAVIDDIYVEDAWSATFSQPAAVGVTNAGNTVSLANIKLANRGGKSTAAYSNKAGLRVAYNTRNSISLGGNCDFSQAAAAQSGGTTGVVYTRLGTQKVQVGTAAPTLGVWNPGDQHTKTNPAAAGSPGEVCVTGGGASSSTWAASMAYSAGVWVKLSTGAVLECTVAGTAGTTEPAVPASIGATVIDGSVTWAYRSPTSAVWKALPALAS